MRISDWSSDRSSSDLRRYGVFKVQDHHTRCKATRLFQGTRIGCRQVQGAAARAGRKLNHWGKPGRQPDEGALAAPPPAIWALWPSQPRSPDRFQAAARRSAPSALREGYARSVPPAPVPLPWRAQTRAPGNRRGRPPPPRTRQIFVSEQSVSVLFELGGCRFIKI